MEAPDELYLHGTHSAEQRRLTRMQELLNGASLRELRLMPGDRVLDIGSGLAQLARAMARVVGPTGQVVGIESSPDQLAEAQRLAHLDGEEHLVDLRRGEATAPPLSADERESFDVVHARFLLEHVADPGAVVRSMLEVLRPGGRIVLEDDDHADLRLHPQPEGFGEVWEAYMQAYRVLGADPEVGRHLVTLMQEAGAEPVRTHCLFFGGCSGQPTFPLLIENFSGIIESARATMLDRGLISAEALDAGLQTFRAWSRRPDAAMWYATCWAEGRRLTAAEEATAGAATDRRGAAAHLLGRAKESADAPRPASAGSALPAAAERPAPAAGPRDDLDDAASLRLLVEAASDLTSSLEIHEVLQRVARNVKSLVRCDLFCVLLWDADTQLLDHSFSVRFDEHVELGKKGGFPLGHGIGGSAAAARSAIRVPDVRDDPRYVRFRHAEVEIRSELAVPLLVKDHLIGVLDLESMSVDAFTQEHERLLGALASQIAIALENARLYDTVRRHERRITQEIDMTREIQEALLPDRPPVVPGLDIGFTYVPAHEVGGDVFDFVTDPRGRLAVVVGDVAGKGAPAALYGALALGILRSQLMESPRGPAQLLEALNEQLCLPHAQDRFLAMSIGIFEPGRRRITLANAGLPRPVLVRGGRSERIPVEGLALGIERGTSYVERTLPLAPDDVLLMWSDGFEEARDLRGDLFGAERARACLERLADAGAQALADALIAATDEHAIGSAREPDDRTALVLRIT